MTISTAYLFIYALLLLSGAYFGLKAGSRISLIMGSVSGALVLIGLALLNVSPQGAKGFLLALAVLLSLTFLKRLIATKKFMPSGMLFIASLLAVVASINLA